jgi:hypothetical protein
MLNHRSLVVQHPYRLWIGRFFAAGRAPAVQNDSPTDFTKAPISWVYVGKCSGFYTPHTFFQSISYAIVLHLRHKSVDETCFYKPTITMIEGGTYVNSMGSIP